MGWKSIVSGIAPTLGMALGGPVGGAAVSFALDALGIKPSGNAEDNERLLEESVKNASPDQLLALRKADNDFKIRMKELGIKEKDLAYKDIASARKREIKVGGWSNPILAGIVVVGFFAVVWMVLSGGLGAMDKAGIAFAGTVVGYVSAKADQVISYYFGSSTGQDHSLSIQANGQGRG